MNDDAAQRFVPEEVAVAKSQGLVPGDASVRLKFLHKVASLTGLMTHRWV